MFSRETYSHLINTGLHKFHKHLSSSNHTRSSSATRYKEHAPSSSHNFNYRTVPASEAFEGKEPELKQNLQPTHSKVLPILNFLLNTWIRRMFNSDPSLTVFAEKVFRFISAILLPIGATFQTKLIL